MPFDIKYRPEIEAGKLLVQTKDGREVRISRWDWPDEDYPIVASINGVEGRFTYTDKGEYDKAEHFNDIDLSLIPNPDYKEPAAEPSVDWEAFRREAAKDIVAACYTNRNYDRCPEEHIAKTALKQADELIKQLKEGAK